jgi:hypothetical protein
LGEIVDDFDVAPVTVEHLADRAERGVAEFEDQAAAGFQQAGGVRDEATVNVESAGAGEERERGFMVADFTLERGSAGLGNVGRVRDDQIETVTAEGGA